MIGRSLRDRDEDEVLDPVCLGGGDEVPVAIPIDRPHSGRPGSAESSDGRDDRSPSGHCSGHGLRVAHIRGDDLDACRDARSGAGGIASDDADGMAP